MLSAVESSPLMCDLHPVPEPASPVVPAKSLKAPGRPAKFSRLPDFFRFDAELPEKDDFLRRVEEIKHRQAVREPFLVLIADASAFFAEYGSEPDALQALGLQFSRMTDYAGAEYPRARLEPCRFVSCLPRRLVSNAYLDILCSIPVFCRQRILNVPLNVSVLSLTDGAPVRRYELPGFSARPKIRSLDRGFLDRCFLELTFVPWKILGILTLGLTDLCYINAYKTATFAEYYAYLRTLAKRDNLAGSERFNDTYLFERAERGLLMTTYADLSLQGAGAVPVRLTGVRGFIERNFGVVMYSREEEAVIWEAERHQLAEEALEVILRGHTYPDRLSPNPIHQHGNHFEKLHYMWHYTVSSLILMFFLFSFVGWLWEVNLHLLSDGVFVNRGILQGPWLPIYGSGCMLILLLLYRLRKSPLKEFIAIVALCGCVEYFTSYFMEAVYHTRWWDYSGYFLNLNGRICAEGLFVFGVGGYAVVYLAAPAVDNWLRRIKPKLCTILCAGLLTLFVCDEVYSAAHPNQGKGVSTPTAAMQDAGETEGKDHV